MAKLILARNNQHGKLAWLCSKDASHFYLGLQAAGWPEPIFKAFSTSKPEFLEVCRALRQ